MGGTILTIPWHAVEAKNLLFILIPEDDWNKHKADPNLAITVLLHKASDVAATFEQTRPMKVEPAEFEKNTPVDRPFGLGKVRWAVVDPTHSSVSIPDITPDKIANMEKLMA